MKRSDMVKFIKNHKLLAKLELSTADADTVLADLEAAGMEPPSAKYWNLNSKGKLEPHSWNGDYKNEWQTDKQIKFDKKRKK